MRKQEQIRSLLESVESIIHLIRSKKFKLRPPSELTDLSMGEIHVLARLGRAGPQTMGELASCDGVKTPTMTEIVGRLEQRALVFREHQSRDRRRVSVVLSEKGTQLLGRLFQARRSNLERVFTRFSESERSKILEFLIELERMLEKSNR